MNFDRDGASNNDKILAAKYAELPEGVMASDWWCSNHRTSLVETAVLIPFAKLIAVMYSACLLVRTNAYFQRLLLAAPVVAKKMSIVHNVTPPVEARLFAAEVKSLAVKNFQIIQDVRRKPGVQAPTMSDEEEEAPSKSLREYEESWDEYLGVQNAPLWEMGFKHFCTGFRCCAGYDRSCTEERLTSSLRGVLLRSMPSVPVKSKWTKTYPALVWFYVGILAHALDMLRDEGFTT